MLTATPLQYYTFYIRPGLNRPYPSHTMSHMKHMNNFVHCNDKSAPFLHAITRTRLFLPRRRVYPVFVATGPYRCFSTREPTCETAIIATQPPPPICPPLTFVVQSQLPDGPHLRLCRCGAVLCAIRRVGVGQALLAWDVRGPTRRGVAPGPS